MTVAETDVLEALASVEDPELHRSIIELDMVRRVSVSGSTVDIEVALTVAGCPLRGEIDRRVRARLAELDGVDEVNLELTVMSDEQRAALKAKLKGQGGAVPAGQPPGHAEGRAIPFADPASSTRVLLIASGKGGVGKSSITANLSISLAQRGRSVAIVDADVWGFSIPRMLGIDQAPVVIDDMLVPPEAFGVRAISMGFFAGEDQPIIWRGPMLHKALEQFLADVFWDDPDYLVIDLPPGTGDVTISMSQYLPRAELYVVTTPQPAAQRVAQRVGFMAEKVNLDLKGVIENMSWFTGDDGTRYEIFGAGGGAELAERLDIPLLGQVPLVTELREGADTGNPIAVADPGSEAARAIASIAESIDAELAPTRRRHPDLRVRSD